MFGGWWFGVRQVVWRSPRLELSPLGCTVLSMSIVLDSSQESQSGGTWAMGVIVKFDQPCWSKCLYSRGLYGWWPKNLLRWWSVLFLNVQLVLPTYCRLQKLHWMT